MNRPAHALARCGLAAFVLLLSGCTTTSRAAGKVDNSPLSRRAVHNPALVLPSTEMLAQANGEQGWDTSAGWWEEARNDPNLGATGSPFTTDFGVAEIRQYEFLRNDGGRPRNDSWTFSRSIQRRFQP